MKSSSLFILFLITSTLCYSQSLETKFQETIDSIYAVHPTAVGIMVHVESPDNKISWSGSVGYSDQENQIKLQPDQPALIASSIKTYVSATLLRLVEIGTLTLEDPIHLYLTEKTNELFKKDGYDFEAIKIKHLMSHTSGISNYATEAYIEDKDKNKQYRWTRDAQLELSIKVGDPLGLPGKQFSYADTNYLLLTEIIENRTDKPFYTAMRELLKYEEIGLNNTWFPTLEEKPEKTKELVHQYWADYKWDSYDLDVSWDLYGGGGIACNTRDMALFIHNYFQGNIVENDSIQQLIFTEIKTPETEEYPYYLGISPDMYHTYTGYGHGGFWGTVMMYFPELNTSISVFILDRNDRILRKDVLDRMTALIIEANQ